MVVNERSVLRPLAIIVDVPAVRHLNAAQSPHVTRRVHAPGIPGPYHLSMERIRKELREA